MDAHQRVLDELTAISTGNAELAAATIHPDCVNHMAADEPAACAQRGVPGAMATSAWLRLAFSDLHFTPIDILSDSTRTVAHVWMSGRQTGPFVVFPPGATPVSFRPTGREFAVRQCHIWLVRDGLDAEHIAVRDDLGMMTQLGHLPPSPASMARMLRWHITGSHRRAVREATIAARTAAEKARPTPDAGR
jgi:ketosteroid isomerase-like protein